MIYYFNMESDGYWGTCDCCKCRCISAKVCIKHKHKCCKLTSRMGLRQCSMV